MMEQCKEKLYMTMSTPHKISGKSFKITPESLYPNQFIVQRLVGRKNK